MVETEVLKEINPRHFLEKLQTKLAQGWRIKELYVRPQSGFIMYEAQVETGEYVFEYGTVAQSVEALVLGTRKWGFESLRCYQFHDRQTKTY